MVWGAIGAAAAGAVVSGGMNKLFGGGGDQTGSTKIKYPDWIKDASKDVIRRGESLADQPYQRYPGQRIAEWGPAQGAAYDMTFDSLGSWRPYIAEGGRLGSGAMSLARPGTFASDDVNIFNGRTLDAREVSPMMWDATQAENYMNPYISEALDPAVRDAQQAFASDILGDRRSASAEGAFGGSRQAILEQESRRRAETGISDMLARGYAGAYESGLDAFTSDANRKYMADVGNVDRDLATGMWNLEQQYRQDTENRAASEREFGLNEDSKWKAVSSLLQGGDFFNRLGQMTSSLGSSDIDRMWAAGDREQNLRQINLDQEYNDWVEARDWDARGMDFMIRALGGTPYGGQPSQVKEYGPGTNSAASIMGGGLTGLSLWQQYQNRNTGTPPPPGGWAPYHADPTPGTSGR